MAAPRRNTFSFPVLFLNEQPQQGDHEHRKEQRHEKADEEDEERVLRTSRHRNDLAKRQEARVRIKSINDELEEGNRARGTGEYVEADHQQEREYRHKSRNFDLPRTTRFNRVEGVGCDGHEQHGVVERRHDHNKDRGAE